MRRYACFLLGLAVTVAYWPGIEAGAATTPRWCVIALTVPALLFFGNTIRITAAHVIGALLVLWLCATLAFTASPLDGQEQAVKLILLGAVFCLGSLVDDLRPLFAGAAIGIAVSSVIAIAQWWGWDAIPVYHSPAGLFFNGNRLAEAAAIVFAGAVALRMWWAVPGLIPALILPQSRTTLLAVGVVAIVWIWQRTRVSVGAALLGGVAIWIVVVIGVVAMLTGAHSPGITERLALWADTLDALNWRASIVFGHGLGSFADTFHVYAVQFDLRYASRPEHPHNEFLWLAFEGGMVAVALGALFAGRLWRAGDREMRLVLLAFGIICMFAMPLHDPATAALGLIVAGAAAGARRDVRDAAWISGSALRPRMAADRIQSAVAR